MSVRLEVGTANPLSRKDTLQPGWERLGTISERLGLIKLGQFHSH